MPEKPFRILIVDDEPENLGVLRLQLECEGLEVITAADGEQALQAHDAQNPNLVLLDAMLPGISGFEVCRALKEKDGRLPVLLLTALVSDEAKMEGFSAGADAFLIKPIEFSELVSQIKYFQDLQSYTTPNAIASDIHSPFQFYQLPIEEIFRDLTERAQPSQRTLYRICSQNQTGYVAVSDEQFIYAHTDGQDGRAALEKMLFWPAATFETVPLHKFNPNCNLATGEMLRWWFSQLPVWRLVLEKLPTKHSLLFLDPHRAGELEKLSSEMQHEAVLFTQGLSVDQVLRRAVADVSADLRRVAELYYLGYLVDGDKISIGMLNVPMESTTSSSLVSQRFTALSPSTDMEESFESEPAEEILDALKMELMGLSATADQLRQENAELRAFSNAAAKTKGAGAEDGTVKIEVDARWQEKFAAAEQALAQAKKESQDREIQAKVLKEKSDALADHVLILKAQLEERKNKVSQLAAAEVTGKAQLHQAMGRISVLEAELKKAKTAGQPKGEQPIQLKAELEEERAKANKLFIQNADLVAKNEKAAQAESAARNELRLEQTRLAKVEKEAAAAATDKSLLTKLQLSLDTERVKGKRAAQEIIDLSLAVAQAQKELQAKAGSKSELEKKAQELERDFGDQLQSKEVTIRKFQSDAEQAKFRLHEAETAKKQFESQLTQLKSQLAAAATEASQWRDQFLKTVDGSKTEMSKATDIFRQAAELKGKLEVAQANAANSNHLVSKLEKDLTASKQEIQATKQELNSAKGWSAKAAVAAGTFIIGGALASLVTALVIRPSTESTTPAPVALTAPAAPVAESQPVAASRPVEVPVAAPVVAVPPPPAPSVPPPAQVQAPVVEPAKPAAPPKAQERKAEPAPKPAAPEKKRDDGKERAIALQKQGRAAYNAADFPKAIRIFNEAIELDASSTLYSDLGKALYDSGDAAKAGAAYKKALRLSDGNAEAHLGTGMIFAERGENMNAKKEFKKFLSLAPRHPLAEQVKSVLGQLP